MVNDGGSDADIAGDGTDVGVAGDASTDDIPGDADFTHDGSTDAGSGDADVDAGVADVPHAPLCDGQQHLRLWVLVETGGQQAPGSRVRSENGSPVITIDGTCSYWVGGGWSEDALRPDRPFHTGKLDNADVTAIEDALPLSNIAALADCPGTPGGLSDYDTREIRTEATTVTCPGTVGARFDAAWSTVQNIANRLWENGAPMDGAIHVSAVGASAGAPRPTYAWPIASPLSSFVLADADRNKIGVSLLVSDADSARQLRALRDQYLADKTAQPGLYGNGLNATDQIATAVVYMRDAIPYEDAQGLLKF